MRYRLTRLLVAPPARLIYRPVIAGAGNVPRRGPVILASNHLSFIDSVVIALLAPRPVVFLAKAEYFESRRTRWFFTAFGAVPVRRGTYRTAQDSLSAAREVLDAGGAFGIYPEGTRSLDGRLYRGRTGVAWLALSTGAPVVPVALTGTEHLQPVGTRLPRIRPVTIRFGAPLTPTGRPDSAKDRRRTTDEIMHAIGSLSNQPRAGHYNEHGKAM
ncbi:lysophospholipid acyltransferase family protein [Actinophytocola sp.]|uniref:lysophospholipid acyltransferase family protein n=1 Tax=Actinophytocola sp. TaxID=1872138 RepID=UPI002D80B1F8|nr:lysophospholipid acyltransferase family protein [Actinophytocola sp.]HET9138660.1 lysophospholipid acyltransferase family protein [Actinophytocola sp.]